MWQTFLQHFSHHQLVNGFDCWQFVVNASCMSQSYFALWGQHTIHWVWLCEQSPFFLLGLPPSFLGHSTLTQACTPLTKSEENERLLTVYYIQQQINWMFRKNLRQVSRNYGRSYFWDTKVELKLIKEGLSKQCPWQPFLGSSLNASPPLSNHISFPYLTNQNLVVISWNCVRYYRKIHYLTREFHVKLHAKTDIARIAKRWVRYRFSSAI